MGPDLSDIGMQRRAMELEKSLLDPGAGVLPQHRFVQVTPKSGPAVTGRLLNQDTFTLQLIDSQERLRTFVIADLREYSVQKDSRMPSYKDKLSRQELADVVSYLVSLKGMNKP
jgi:putative heme-binding domain-containing protein